MRILQVVAGEKWTGAAAVVFDQTAALVAAGVEAQFAFVAESPLARRLLPLGWARPLLSRSPWPLRHLVDARRLRETLQRERFELVHAHRSHDHYLAAAATRSTGIRLARTFHSLGQIRRDPLSRALFSRTDAFAYSSSEIAAAAGRGGPVLSPVVDPARFSPGEGGAGVRARLGVPPGAFVVGTVGKLALGRGHEEAIDALAALSREAVLLHVGTGERRPRLERRAKRLGLSARNFWAGYQEEALPDLYRAMDVFLFPASGSDQGQRAVLEAMASGLPVVARPVPGVADLLTDGVEGFLAPEVPGLVAALGRLANDAALRGRTGERARRRALDFTAESFVRRAVPFYEGLLASIPRDRPRELYQD